MVVWDNKFFFLLDYIVIVVLSSFCLTLSVIILYSQVVFNIQHDFFDVLNVERIGITQGLARVPT